jgi:hypothetical protein
MARRRLDGIPTPIPFSPNPIRALEKGPLSKGESRDNPTAFVPALGAEAIDGQRTARIDG